MSARIDAAYAARYESQLEELTWDLPELPPERALVRRPAGAALGPVAAAGGLAAGGVALAALVPPEAWAMLVGFALPLLMMALFTVAPLAIPVLAVLWFMREAGRPPGAGRVKPWRGG